MKALVLERNGVLQCKDVPVPRMANDECLVVVRSAGICSSDIPRAFSHGANHYPLIMGHEFAGQVRECGPDVSEFSPGDTVVAFPLIPCYRCTPCLKRQWSRCEKYDYYGSRRDGAFCELIAVKSWNLVRVLGEYNTKVLGLAEPLAVCLHALSAIPRDFGGRLAIVGAGFMGLSLAKLAAREGRFSEIRLFDRNRFKLDLAERFGFSACLLGSDCGRYGVEADQEGSFDAVIEAAGAVETYRLSLALCGNGAHLVWMGNIAGDLTLVKDEVSAVLRREVSIHGVWNSEFQSHGPSDWSQALAVLGTEEWVGSLVTHWPSLEEGPQVFRDLYSIKQRHRPHSYIKACFLLGNDS